MSNTTPNKSKDPTFSDYNTAQANTYAETRQSYPPELYNTVLRHHANTGERFNTLLDVGCGPGNATRDLVRSFDNVVGIDPGVEMIQVARRLRGQTETGRPIQFRVRPAEDCACVPGVENGADLLAHWFSMPEFWASAREIVNPCGTVALWTCASLYCHPSTPNAAAVQSALFHLEENVLAPYELPANRLSRGLYDNLPLPWTVDPPVSGFAENDLVRIEWDRDGVLTDGEEFFVGGKEVGLEELEKSLGTASMVTRWRAANPQLAHTSRDCVTMTISEVKEVMGEHAGGKLRVGNSCVVLFFKRTQPD